MENLNSAEGAAIWARRILPAKNSLHEADARQVGEAFKAKLAVINSQSNPISGIDRQDVPPATLTATDQAAEAIDKSELTHPEPRRIRDKNHLRFVSTQPCLIRGRTPADPHHLRFAQSRALSRKVSDEFIVPLCRGHHRDVHRCSEETAWWRERGIDALDVARVLWLEFHPQGTEQSPIQIITAPTPSKSTE